MTLSELDAWIDANVKCIAYCVECTVWTHHEHSVRKVVRFMASIHKDLRGCTNYDSKTVDGLYAKLVAAYVTQPPPVVESLADADALAAKVAEPPAADPFAACQQVPATSVPLIGVYRDNTDGKGGRVHFVPADEARLAARVVAAAGAVEHAEVTT